MAKYKASKNDFRAAYELTQLYGEPVALPRVGTNFSLQDLENRFAAAPYNDSIAYELYRGQCRMAASMMPFLPRFILANGQTPQRIFIS